MDSVAGIIEAVGHLPVMLQIFFIIVFSIAFFVLLFFGFGKNSKKWKGLIHLVREHTEMKDEQVSMFKEMPLSFDLKSKSDDIDREARMRIFRRARSIIFTLLSDYQDSCPLIVWNLRSELENEFRQYIFENHLIKKSFKSSAESEKRRIETTVKEVYEQVVRDLTDAAECLEGVKPTTVYRAGESAAYAMLSRVYLYMGNWEAALAACEKVENKGYGMVDLNTYVWGESVDGVSQSYMISSSPETIFSNGSNVLGQLFMHDSYSNYRAFRVSDGLLQLFLDDMTDLRRNVFIRSAGGHYRCGKVVSMSPRIDVGDCFVLRYPEILLNKAEALAMLDRDGEAVQALNDLRRYRYEDHNAPAITETGEELMNFIRTERRKELCFEGHRWFDLRRYAVSPKYPLKVAITHGEYRDGDSPTTSSHTEGTLLREYTLQPWPESPNWVMPIPVYEMEYNKGTMVDNEREESEHEKSN